MEIKKTTTFLLIGLVISDVFVLIKTQNDVSFTYSLCSITLLPTYNMNRMKLEDILNWHELY